MILGEISNTTTYDGEVTINLVKDGNTFPIKTKNAGTKFLRDLICKALYGVSDIQMDIPRFIGLNYIVSKSDGAIGSGSLLHANRVPVDTRTYGEVVGSNDEQSILLLKALISKDDIAIRDIDDMFSNAKSGKVYLSLENAAGNILATIDNYYDNGFTENSIVALYNSIKGNDGVDAMIEWRLVFKNGGNK